MRETIIIGSGPAGGAARMRSRQFEAAGLTGNELGGQLALPPLSKISWFSQGNRPGTGRNATQAERFGAAVKIFHPRLEAVALSTDQPQRPYTAKTVIVATGASPKLKVLRAS